MTGFTVRSAPYAYVCKIGILEDLEEQLIAIGYGKVLVIHGRYAKVPVVIPLENRS